VKAADIKAAIARGEKTFAVADNVNRFGLLSTVTASRVERGMVVVVNRRGVEVDKRWRPALLIPLAEALAIIAAREAESEKRERELWGEEVAS
jgi:hypothetical protein